MTSETSDKYLVFKADDARSALANGLVTQSFVSMAIPDAWVIRKQDTHAAATVYTYASAVQTTIEILEGLDKVNNDTAHRADVVESLTRIRDAAFAFAQDAVRTDNHRLPD